MSAGALQKCVLGMLPDAEATDGSQVRLLVTTGRGSLAHFTLAPGCVSRAVRHRTVDEVWFFLSAKGKMWRRYLDEEPVLVDVEAGVALTIPVGTAFQFRADMVYEPLAAVGTTMPPWPGENEAVLVEGPWQASLPD